MDITSPALLKLKAALFLVIVLLCSVLLAVLVYPLLTWRVIVLYFTCLWACSRAYYFCFYVMEHYAEPGFRYAGLLDLARHLAGLKKSRKP